MKKYPPLRQVISQYVSQLLKFLQKFSNNK
jgi:hypothetical protein